MSPPKPQAQAPELHVETLDGGRWRLSDRKPDRFTMIVFYRGLHCPVCTSYISELNRKLDDFSSRGVEAIAVSGDPRERAERSRDKWKLDNITLGFGLSPDAMREWGLFVSKGIKQGEPAEFGEPGLFLITPGGTVFYGGINSMPFGRPKFDEIRDGIDFVTDNDYPARGES
ncbi:MAG: AhpC/TSA family protein [Thermoleophilaceae bacterium]|nr:AhpC/TSA family protein [Thermoleophilaceae bacterium]